MDVQEQQKEIERVSRELESIRSQIRAFKEGQQMLEGLEKREREKQAELEQLTRGVPVPNERLSVPFEDM